jgi:hypothetical protein
MSKRNYQQNKKLAQSNENRALYSEAVAQHPRLATYPKSRPAIGQPAPQPPQTNRTTTPVKIFVGGLHPATKRNELVELIKQSLGITVGCFQLRTKYPTYTSFCLTTDEDFGDILLCSNVWPEGAKVMHFRGRQRRPTTDTPISRNQRNAPLSSPNNDATADLPPTSNVNQQEAYAHVTIRRKKITSSATNGENEEHEASLRLSESESETLETETEIEPREEVNPNSSIHHQ